MTPLAAKVANELTLPKARRTFDDRGGVLDLLDQEMHCFEVSALSKSINAVLDGPIADDDPDESWSTWRDIESMAPAMFLPSPVTWLEQRFNGARFATVLREQEGRFIVATVHESARAPFSIPFCTFRIKSILEPGERIDVDADGATNLFADDEVSKNFSDLLINRDPALMTPSESHLLLANKRALTDRIRALTDRIDVLERRAEILHSSMEVLQTARRFIGMAVLTLDLINTPGLIGLRQREINKALARRLNVVGSYPLRAWSEVVLKHQTKVAEPGERVTGATYHKCLHFVRSHLRHYRDGSVTMIPAHWRGDPALGIKRTRYRLAA